MVTPERRGEMIETKKNFKSEAPNFRRLQPSCNSRPGFNVPALTSKSVEKQVDRSPGYSSLRWVLVHHHHQSH
jgi:hypothetical protein